MERHIFRGYLVFIEDIRSDSMSMTKDLIQKIHDESNSRDEFCQKLGEIFWDRCDGLKPMLPVTVNSQLKTETGQLTSPTVSQVHGYPGYCPRLPPMSDQCYGTQQISLVQTHISSDRQDMAHPTAIESDPSRNARPNHTGTNKDGSSDQCNGIQKLSLAHDHLSLASPNCRKIAATIPIESYPSMKAKQNCIYTNNNGSEIEREWIE